MIVYINKMSAYDQWEKNPHWESQWESQWGLAQDLDFWWGSWWGSWFSMRFLMRFLILNKVLAHDLIEILILEQSHCDSQWECFSVRIVINSLRNVSSDFNLRTYNGLSSLPCISHIALFRQNNLIAWQGRPRCLYLKTKQALNSLLLFHSCSMVSLNIV